MAKYYVRKRQAFNTKVAKLSNRPIAHNVLQDPTLRTNDVDGTVQDQQVTDLYAQNYRVGMRNRSNRRNQIQRGGVGSISFGTFYRNRF